MDTVALLSLILTLLLVMDPIGNIPLFLSLLKDLEPKRRRFVIVREMLIALAVMLIFLFFGSHILGFLGLKTQSVAIAGAIVLFLIALRMIFPQDGGPMGEIEGEPLVVPLAIPLVAGPSTLATLILFSAAHEPHFVLWSGALMVAWGISLVILLCSTKLYHLLGERGIAAMERLMGMVLVMISVQMFMDGVIQFVQLQKAAG
jgi:multiple antibiotic resistance protein